MTTIKGNRPVSGASGVGEVGAVGTSGAAARPTELDRIPGEQRVAIAGFIARGNLAKAAEMLRNAGANELAATLERTDDGAVSLFAQAATRSA